MRFQGAERSGNRKGRQKLVSELRPRGETEVAAMHDLQVIVGKPDRSKRQRRRHRDPDEAVAQIGPQQRGDDHADHDEHSAHGGCPGFLLVGLRAILAYVLADLEFTQTANHGRADDKTDEQCGEAGERGAEGQIAKDSERTDVEDDETLLVKQPIEQISFRPESSVRTSVCSNRRFAHPHLERAFQANSPRRFQQDRIPGPGFPAQPFAGIFRRVHKLRAHSRR